MARVLIVDDKPEIRLLLKAAVEREGHRALLAADADQAWGMLQQEPDIMFADVGLPGESGLELTSRVRAEARYANIPVVFITAMSDTLSTIRATVDQPMAIVEKPFRFEQVAKAIRDVLPND